MATKNLSKLSVSELTSKKISLKTILGAFAGILSVFAIMLILLFMQKQYTIALPLLVVLFSLSSVLFISKKQLSDIKSKLETRNNNNNNHNNNMI
jgi:cobalamin biosynthesis protein CobD/CbiB